VTIRSGSGRRSGGGSGVVLTNDRVITNAHVLQGGGAATVESWEGKSVSAQVVRVNQARDLALLSVAGLDSPAIQFGDSDDLRAGTPVMAIGNPLGFTGAVSSGVVHAASAALKGMYRWICADVRLAPGNSGGPLADLQGRVIGINTMVISGGLALAVPSRAVQGFIARDKHPAKLGVTLRPVTPRRGEAGMMILEIETGGAADNASLLPGDILLTANGRGLHFLDDLQTAVGESAGALLRLEFCRGGEARRRQVSVQLAPERATAAA
jgi:serine protease Do